MSWSRRSRPLTPEERRLWAHVARGVTPLDGRTLPVDPEPQPDGAQHVRSDDQPAPGELAARSPATRQPPIAALDRRTITALRRGTQQIEGVIDLHGMRQSEAHAALIGFLRRSQDSGRKLVLVITGKGAAGTHTLPDTTSAAPCPRVESLGVESGTRGHSARKRAGAIRRAAAVRAFAHSTKLYVR